MKARPRAGDRSRGPFTIISHHLPRWRDDMATIEKHVTRELVQLDGAIPCAEAARLMSAERIGSVAVREGARIVGIITERDLVARVLAEGAPGNLPIRAAMRSDLPTVSPNTSDVACL